MPLNALFSSINLFFALDFSGNIANETRVIDAHDSINKRVFVRYGVDVFGNSCAIQWLSCFFNEFHHSFIVIPQ